ncbi:MAG: hypothetical protein RBJ76_11335 [Stenomitos frigidus ULC029]
MYSDDRSSPSLPGSDRPLSLTSVWLTRLDRFYLRPVLRSGSDWERFPVNTSTEQAQLLDRLSVLSSTSNAAD